MTIFRFLETCLKKEFSDISVATEKGCWADGRCKFFNPRPEDMLRALRDLQEGKLHVAVNVDNTYLIDSD
jgi:hypothetical protein